MISKQERSDMLFALGIDRQEVKQFEHIGDQVFMMAVLKMQKQTTVISHKINYFKKVCADYDKKINTHNDINADKNYNASPDANFSSHTSEQQQQKQEQQYRYRSKITQADPSYQKVLDASDFSFKLKRSLTTEQLTDYYKNEWNIYLAKVIQCPDLTEKFKLIFGKTPEECHNIPQQLTLNNNFIQESI